MVVQPRVQPLCLGTHPPRRAQAQEVPLVALQHQHQWVGLSVFFWLLYNTNINEFHGPCIESTCVAALVYLQNTGIVNIDDANFTQLKTCKRKLQAEKFWSSALYDRAEALRDQLSSLTAVNQGPQSKAKEQVAIYTPKHQNTTQTSQMVSPEDNTKEKPHQLLSQRKTIVSTMWRLKTKRRGKPHVECYSLKSKKKTGHCSFPPLLQPNGRSHLLDRTASNSHGFRIKHFCGIAWLVLAQYVYSDRITFETFARPHDLFLPHVYIMIVSAFYVQDTILHRIFLD